MSGAGDLADRLRGLLSEAREAGRLEELRAIVEGAFAGPPAGPVAPGGAGGAEADGVPAGRFGMVGTSPAMRAVYDLVDRVGPSDVAVLVQGETGTGKELVARALHVRSGRKGRFIAENCAAVPAGLLESELFGHVKGAFTGAVAGREGCFVAADGGTLFLDEIGDMPLEMQAKLLRVQESGEIRPVGGSGTREVDVRVVAATNMDLAAMVAERRFREDLYYRLDVVRIDLPPLREREGDVPLLARFFLGRAAAEEDRPGARLTDEVLAALEAYDWPGNVRQLENEIRRAVALGRDGIGPEDLSPDLRSATHAGGEKERGRGPGAG